MTDPPKGVTVYITVPTQQLATELAEALVNERLAACVNILPGVVSVYRWEGELHQHGEVLVLAKTRSELAGRVCARVAELHCHDVPCVVVLPWVAGLPAYGRWVAEQTEDPGLSDDEQAGSG